MITAWIELDRGMLRPFLITLAIGLATNPAMGRPGPENGYRSLESAVSQARKETGGRVLSARTREQKGQKIHVIRILTKDGRVRRLRMDARNGRLLQPSGKR